MSPENETFEKLKGVLTTGFGLRDDQVVPSARLAEDLDLDSLDLFDLAVRLEQEIGQEVQEDEMKSIRTIQDVVDIMYRKLETKPA